MKKNLIVLLLFLAITKLHGQGYYTIDFESEGATIESIRVENLTQGTSVVLDGTDVLHLLLKTGSVFDIEMNCQKLKIFPNPMEQTCNIDFVNAKEGIVSIMLYSIAGKQIYNYNNFLSQGNHSFSLSGVASGSYIISVQTETNFSTGMFVSINQIESLITLTHKEGIKSNTLKKTINNLHNNKGKMSIVEMNYDVDDELKFTGYANGFGSAVVFDSPSDNQTYTFVFAELYVCGDPYTDTRDGYTYQTVQIGNQCWFSENLRYLPEGEDFDPASGGSGSTPFYYIYDFARGGSMDTLMNDSTYENYLKYGILYNWNAAMQCEGNSCAEETQGICPDGWHMPTHVEWTTLEKNLGSDPDAFPYEGATVGFLGTDEGDAIKHPDADWCVGTPACGTSGFNALPGGRRYSGGIYYGIGTGARWWTSTEFGAGAWRRYLDDVEPGINRFTDYKPFGFSVRCIRD